MKILSRIVFAAVLAATISQYAFSHCDTMDGPVVKDAQAALDKGDIAPALKWVHQGAEPEVRQAFKAAVTERKKGEQARETADRKFFETLIRFHRSGEGAEYAGLKPAGTVEPIIAEADRALEMGSSEVLITKMTSHLNNGVKRRFDRVLELSKHKDESVEAGREYVAAYVEYTHFVEGIHKALAGQAADHGEPHK